MTMIVSGTFVTFEDAAQAVARLRLTGADAGAMAQFYRSPDGQHVPPGEVSSSPDPGEARGAGTGAATGAGVGATVGVATGLLAATAAGPLGAALGAALGAYAGSLPGALGGAGQGEASQPPTPHRYGGPVVALAISGPEAERAVRQILADAGARQVEVAEGRLVNGEWVDYDPASVPNLVFERG